MMKKLIVSLAAVAVFGIFNIAFLNSVNSAPICDKGKITADASEFKYVSPDTATISFTVETTDKNSQKAVELNNQQVTKLLDAIKKNLAQNETVKTSVYNMRQNYEYNNVTKKNVMTGYIVTNTITVMLKDTQKTGKIIDLATKNGATRVSGLSFTLQSTDAVCKELTAKAVAKAKAEAQNVLTPLGKTIDSVDSVNYNCSTNSTYAPYRNYAMAKGLMGAEAADSSSVSVEAGETKVEASVTIVFTIK